MNQILTGLDRLGAGEWKRLKGYHLGLLANPASLDAALNPAKEVIARVLPGQLKALFGPQHGHDAEDQDNMVETGHAYDKALNVPVFSLYSNTREPLPQMLELLDILIIDLQDVGTRVYTFASTMLLCLKAAAKYHKKVLVLDRPNPLGGDRVEGNILQPELFSFVGPYSFPMRHGLTMGEMALIFNDALGLGCDLDIIPMQGWRRGMLWHETARRWIMPSPNMPLPETTQVYPGQVIWEGTNLSEGRGTCRPFEIFGAPFLDPRAVKSALDPEAAKGCVLQEFAFRPTFNKWEGRRCRGFLIHVLEPRLYRPYFTSVALLKAVIETHAHVLEWKKPPYEYEHTKRPIDIIVGDSSLVRELESGASLAWVQEKWQADQGSFLERRRPYLLYE